MFFLVSFAATPAAIHAILQLPWGQPCFSPFPTLERNQDLRSLCFSPAAFTSLSQCPRLPVSPVSLCSTLLQPRLPILPSSYTSRSCYPPNSHLFLASQAVWDSASLLASLHLLQDATTGGRGPIFRYDLPAGPHIVSGLFLLSLEAMSGFPHKAWVSG